jgi:prophage regulatory protein
MALPERPTELPHHGVLAIDAHGLAEILGLSLRSVRRLDASGKLPKPLRIGGAVRWRLSEITAWMDAGCPDRAEWERTKGGRS